MLGAIYEKGLFGIKKNEEIAFRYYMKSTRKSLSLYGVDQEVYKSILKLKKSIDLNESEEDYIKALREVNKNDKILKKNRLASKSYLLLSAEGGYVDAQVALGRLYSYEFNYKESSKWYVKAMEQGDKEAFAKLNIGWNKNGIKNN